MIIEVAPGVHAAEEDLRISYCRSSGPGGQNVNKVNTKAELRVALDALRGLAHYARQKLIQLAGDRLNKENELIFTADYSRSQEFNRDAVHEKLRELIVQAQFRPKPRRATKPSRASKERRLDGKKRRSHIKAMRRMAD